jgi:hypothetical protein
MNLSRRKADVWVGLLLVEMKGISDFGYRWQAGSGEPIGQGKAKALAFLGY